MHILPIPPPAPSENIDRIRQRLRAQPAKLIDDPSRGQAAVALILHPTEQGTEVLFIERALHQQDPWSGNLAFPGGRIDSTDFSARQAAERETLEEIGLDLTQNVYLGQLDDITGAYLPVRVSCFVYSLNHGKRPSFRLNHEVRDLFFFPLAELSNPLRHIEADIDWDHKIINSPAIDLLGPDRPLLWGITYRLNCQFLQRIRQSRKG
jgi:8-oxo-dGTP pyrophosphatase MutT (NUDIX family)